MSEPKFTPGPWRVELIAKWPFGVRVYCGDKTIMHQQGACYSSMQATREDHEQGFGFPYHAKGIQTDAETARQLVAEQVANANLIAAAPDLYASLIEIQKMLDADSEYSVCRSNGRSMDFPEAIAVGSVFERASAALAKARGES